jgi:hypothetical protein
MAKNPARSTYSKAVGDIAVTWNILERRLNSLIFHYLTVDSTVAGFILGEMRNDTKENFAKLLIQRYEKNESIRVAGLFAVQLVKRLCENRNTLEHSVPHLSHDSRYLGLIVKPDRRGLSVLYTVPMHQLTRLVDSMRTAEKLDAFAVSGFKFNRE